MLAECAACLRAVRPLAMKKKKPLASHEWCAYVAKFLARTMQLKHAGAKGEKRRLLAFLLVSYR